MISSSRPGPLNHSFGMIFYIQCSISMILCPVILTAWPMSVYMAWIPSLILQQGSLVGSNRPLPLLDDQTWIQFQTLGAHSRQPTIWCYACINDSLDRIYCRRYLQRSQRFQWLRSSHGCGAFLEGINPCSSCHSELNPSNLLIFVIENFRLTVVCSYHLSSNAYAIPLSWTTSKQLSIGFERIGYANKPPARDFTHWVDRDKDVNEVMISNQVRERL